MKHIATILFILTVALCLFCASLVLEMRDKDRLDQSTIDGLRKKNQVERDSLDNVLKLTSDSLEIAFSTIRLAHEQSQEARKRSQKTIADLQKIIFVTHTDSSRNAELKSLYKSYMP